MKRKKEIEQERRRKERGEREESEEREKKERRERAKRDGREREERERENDIPSSVGVFFFEGLSTSEMMSTLATCPLLGHVHF